MGTDGVRIRRLTKEEIAVAVNRAAAEGWNPGLRDAECFWPVDPEGFFCAEKDGKIVATAAVVNYDDRFSFGGFYIVDPAFRNHGVGMQVARHAMDHAGSRVLGVDGVVAMVQKYERAGALFLHYNNARYEGRGGGLMPGGLTSIMNVNFADLLAYDTAHFFSRRETFLRCWIAQEGHFGLARLDADGKILGYGYAGNVLPATRSGRSLQRAGQLRSSSSTGSFRGSRANLSISISRFRTRPPEHSYRTGRWCRCSTPPGCIRPGTRSRSRWTRYSASRRSSWDKNI